jgi:HK97 family phage portal protein
MRKTTTFNRAGPVPFTPTYQMESTLLASILGQTLNPVYVSETSVGGLPAIGRGIDLVSGAVATMLVGADVYTSEDVVTRPQIVHRPNVIFGSYEFYKMVTASLMMRGNFVGILADFDELGYARQVIPVHPDAVTMDTSTGLPFYEIHHISYAWDEVIHLRANAPIGGLWGQGIIERYRTNLEGQLYEQQYGTSTYKNGSVPSAIITLDTDKVEETTAEAVQTSWMGKHGSGERKPAVVPRTMKIEPIGFSPKDTEWVQGRQLSIAEAALMCGLDPADLTASVGGTNMTYANLASRQIARITDSYSPWLNVIEQGWSDLLPDGMRVRGNAEALLRTSTQERYELHKTAIEAGWMTPDEVRDIEGLAPVGELPDAEEAA